MYGMDFMSDSVSPLKDMPEFTSMLTAFTNPLLGILTGLVLTAIIQSSSASVGIPAGAVFDGKHFLRYGNSDYYGTEYRHMCDGFNFKYRCES